MTRDIVRKEEGAIALEYVLLIIFVALAILVGAGVFASSVSGKFTQTGNAVSAKPINPLP